MTVTNSSAARRAGLKVNDESVKDGANIAMSKVGTRTLSFGFAPNSFHLTGASVAISSDGVFTVVKFPDANTATIYTAFRLPAEFVVGDVTVDIYWKSAVITGNAKFTGSIASKVASEDTALDETQNVITAAGSVANKIIKSTLTFDSGNFTAADFIGLLISRNPADGSDDLTADLDIVHVVANFTGRG